MIVASRWLEWFEKKITGPVHALEVLEAVDAQRHLAPQQRPHRALQDQLPGGRAGLGPCPRRSGRSSLPSRARTASAERGTSGRRPQRKPSAIVFSSSRMPAIAVSSPHVRDHHGRRMEVGHRRRRARRCPSPSRARRASSPRAGSPAAPRSRGSRRRRSRRRRGRDRARPSTTCRTGARRGRRGSSGTGGVPGVGGVPLLELRLDLLRVGGLGAAPLRRSRCSSGGGSGGTPTAPGGAGSPRRPRCTSGLFRYMLNRYPSPRQCTRIGFRIEFTLYGPR